MCIHGHTAHYTWLKERKVALPPYTEEALEFYATKLAKISLLGLEESEHDVERLLARLEARQCRRVLGNDNKNPPII